ncbi:MAG: hypothetical protein ACLSCO_17310 [Gallintestinimicrobium sp.]
MVQKKADSIHQLDGWNLEFRKKYREGAAAFPELHHKACGGVRGEQHRIEAGADCIRGG